MIDFLLSEWTKYPTDDRLTILVTRGKECFKLLGNGRTVKIDELSTDHEEADTRMLLHAAHVAASGIVYVIIESNDTDVFILCLGLQNKLSSHIILKFGKSDMKKCIDIHSMCTALGETICKAIIGFHCFTGCDTTSAFYGKGKVRPFTLLVSSDSSIRNAICRLGEEWELDVMSDPVEKFVCAIYGSKESHVDAARYKLFVTNALGERKLPPTRDSLRLHLMRCNYQAKIQKSSFNCFMHAPSPTNHGWIMEDGVLCIEWMTMDPMPKELMEHSKCKCPKSGCDKRQCPCFAAGVSCTDFCECANCKNVQESALEKELMNDESGSDESDDEGDKIV
jgi:hypothetical protein